MSMIPALMGGRALEHDAAFESGFGLKTKAGEKLLTVDSSDRTMVVADQARIKGFKTNKIICTLLQGPRQGELCDVWWCRVT